MDLVKDGDTDIQDLLRGDAALLDAAKKGCLARVKKLSSPDNVNCRDTQGRHSTPLHLAGEWIKFYRFKPVHLRYILPEQNASYNWTENKISPVAPVYSSTYLYEATILQSVT